MNILYWNHKFISDLQKKKLFYWDIYKVFLIGGSYNSLNIVFHCKTSTASNFFFFVRCQFPSEWFHCCVAALYLQRVLLHQMRCLEQCSSSWRCKVSIQYRYIIYILDSVTVFQIKVFDNCIVFYILSGNYWEWHEWSNKHINSYPLNDCYFKIWKINDLYQLWLTNKRSNFYYHSYM